MVSFGLIAGNGVIAPLISQLYSTGKLAELQRMLSLSSLAITICATAALIILVVFGRQVMHLFGAQFDAAYIPLLILVAGQWLNAVCGPTGFLMTMTGHQSYATRVFSICLLLNLTANMELIPKYGPIGAAISTAIALGLWNLILLKYILKNLRINPTMISGNARTVGVN